jgi:hypothetical protein
MRMQPRRPPIRRLRRHKTTQVFRYQIAVAVVILFGCVCLGMVLVPNNSLFEKLLPFVAAPLTLVLNYYFGRRGGE